MDCFTSFGMVFLFVRNDGLKTKINSDRQWDSFIYYPNLKEDLSALFALLSHLSVETTGEEFGVF